MVSSVLLPYVALTVVEKASKMKIPGTVGITVSCAGGPIYVEHTKVRMCAACGANVQAAPQTH